MTIFLNKTIVESTPSQNLKWHVINPIWVDNSIVGDLSEWGDMTITDEYEYWQ